MTRTPGFIDNLDATSLGWLRANGRRVPFRQGSRPLDPARAGTDLVVLLSGALEVHGAAMFGSAPVTLGSGELIDDGCLAGATEVTVRIPGEALVIDRAHLRGQLEADPVFGRDFHRACLMTLVERMRRRHTAHPGAPAPGTPGRAAVVAAVPDGAGAGQAHRTGGGAVAGTPPAEHPWTLLRPHLERFKHLVATCDRQALRTGAVPTDLADQVRAAVGETELRINQVLGDGTDATARAQVGARVQAELLPYVLMSRHAERWYAKPRGYAGDYLTIAQIYADRADGVGRVGAVLDRGFLDLAATRAVRNRRPLLVREILRSVQDAGTRPAAVTSLACGPAREVLDAYDTLADPGRLTVTLLDLDAQALEYVAERLDIEGLAGRATLLRANLVHVAAGRQQVPVADQDLVYSIGLIDYLPDRSVVALMDAVHGMLRPGGRVILGNFHPRNATRAVMDHVLDWRLRHRTEADMDRLYRASRFARPCTRVRYEEQRINLFAECVRS